MDNSVEFTRAEEIATIRIKKPHVVLLGAGASKAALPNGDANGKQLPLMNNFVDVLQLSEFLESAKIVYEGRNFEDVFTELHSIDSNKEICNELEMVIYNYFSDLYLPDEPTIYDYLILGLREKDLIATFNWDPFLVQAAIRNSKVADPPQLLFLHGNVKVGFCLKHRQIGRKGNLCSKCRKPLIPTKLLYPIKEKNYDKDQVLASQWEMLRYAMKHTFQFTVFGYSAPKTDISAIELLKLGWGSSDKRIMELTEIVDIQPEDALAETWQDFLYSHHYRVHDSFLGSSIANHPRRTGEAYWAQCVEGKFIEENKVPLNISLPELQNWFKELRAVELAAKK